MKENKKGLQAEIRSRHISDNKQVLDFFFKRLWLSFVKRNICFRIVHHPKKSRCPSRMTPDFKKMEFQKIFYSFKVILFTRIKRLKNTFVKSSCSAFYQIPHIVIGHTSVWHMNKNQTRRGA